MRSSTRRTVRVLEKFAQHRPKAVAKAETIIDAALVLDRRFAGVPNVQALAESIAATLCARQGLRLHLAAGLAVQVVPW